MSHSGCLTQSFEGLGGRAVNCGATDWRCNQSLFFATALLLAALSGCGSEQQSNVGSTGNAQVSLNITMPDQVAAASHPRNTFLSTVQRWFFPTDVWAATVNEIVALVVQVTGPGIPSPVTNRVPVSGASGGQVIPVTLDVPVGADRVFTVSALNATNITIFRGESRPTTLTAGKAANVDVALVNITAPTANAGPDQGGKLPGAIVTLNGSGSSDPNGDLLTYRWTFSTRPAGSQASLANANSVSPSFTVDRDGDYVIQLIVNDGSVDSSPDTVIVSSTNVAPVANAGQDQGNKTHGALITLNGSASSDANGDPLTYRWSFKARPVGSQATLVNPTSVLPTFSIDRDGTYEIQLVVNDGTVDSDPDTVIINSSNVKPVANAGPDQAGAFPAGTVITLNGSASSDVNGDRLTYRWAFTTKPDGSQSTLSNPTSVRPTFTLDRDGAYVIQLIVNDGQDNSEPDTVIVRGGNIAPVAEAGPAQGNKLPDSVVTLNGSGSSDPNGDPLTYRWSFTSRPAGSQAVLVNPTSVSPTFVIDRDGDYVIQLIVNDGTVDSPPDTVTVNSTNVAPVANAGPDQTVTFPEDSESSLTVTLDGSGSKDANLDPLTYRWSFTSVPPSSEGECELSLDNATSVNPSFSPFCTGTYVLQLIVNDGTVDSLKPDTVTITVTELLRITTASKLPDGTNGFPYDPSEDSLVGFQLQAFGGVGSYTWSTIGGAWPPDITLSSDGVISGGGKAPCSGVGKEYSITVQVKDANGATAEQVFTLAMRACIG